MSTLIKILFFVVVVYLILKYLGRFFLSILFRNIESKVNDQKEVYSKKKEGEVTITSKREMNNKTKNVGEYVDFEEIDDKN